MAIWVECGPLPPSWAPGWVGSAGTGCGNGCQECPASRGCCSHCDPQTFQIHLERKERVRPEASKGPHNGAAGPEGPFSDPGLDWTGGDRSEAWPRQQEAALEPIQDKCPLFLALSLRDRDTPFPEKQQHGHRGPPRTSSQRGDQLCP